MALAAIPERQADEVSMNVKRTFIEIAEPKAVQRVRCCTDSELLRIDEHEDVRMLDIADIAVKKPIEEEIVHKPVDWESPYWGPAGDLFYSHPVDTETFTLPTNASWGYQDWSSMTWALSPMQEQWCGASNLNSGWDLTYSSGEQSYKSSAAERSHKTEVGRWKKPSINKELSYPLEPQRVLDEVQEIRTTVMLRNVPTWYTRSDAVRLLVDEGFDGCFDLVYLPMDFNNQRCLGYAFVNFHTASDAKRAWTVFDGFCAWGHHGASPCEVVWSSPHQGSAALIERYRNSPVMHDSMPDEWKPAYFIDGERVQFPTPTERIKAPKQKQSRRSKTGANA